MLQSFAALDLELGADSKHFMAEMSGSVLAPVSTLSPQGMKNAFTNGEKCCQNSGNCRTRRRENIPTLLAGENLKCQSFARAPSRP
jgi:hypothetical protein